MRTGVKIGAGVVSAVIGAAAFAMPAAAMADELAPPSITVTADGTAPIAGDGSSTDTQPAIDPAASRLLTIWIAAGGIMLTGGAIAVAVSVHRNRKLATEQARL